MLKEVFKNIFLNEVTLPKNPLKALNCYIIKDTDRTLVIDSGFDHPETEELFFKGLEEIGAEIGKTDMFVTHLHADHSGLAAKFKAKYKGKVYCSETDTTYINSMHDVLYSQHFVPILNLMGINQGVDFFATHPGLVYCIKEKIETTLVKEGDQISIGNYNFEVVDVTGHTPGHLALYDKNSKIFFGGDHILNKITPNISFWHFKYGDILGTYLKNLDKIYNLDINIVFSAHRNIIENHKLRIDELKKHYTDRNLEVLNLLKQVEKASSVEIAAKMKWDYRANNFEEFPNNQKWFATGEALANLEHLRALGLADYQFIDGVAFYRAL